MKSHLPDMPNIDYQPYVVYDENKKSEFKLFTTLGNLKFELSDSFDNKIDIIGIQVSEYKYSFKILNFKPGTFSLMVYQQNKLVWKTELVFS